MQVVHRNTVPEIVYECYACVDIAASAHSFNVLDAVMDRHELSADVAVISNSCGFR